MTREDRRQESPPGLREGAAILEQLARGPGGAPPPLPQQLAIAGARYRALIEQIPAVTFMASLESGISDVYVSPQIEGLLGFSQAEWMSDPVLWFRQLHPDDRDLWNQEFARGCATGGPFRAECRFLAKDGQIVWVHGEARLIADDSGQPVLLQGVAFDITESKRAEEIVKTSLREKELLLKEIHHRVKNNLQITSSLLRLQAGKIADDSVRQLLRDSQDRIRSMALVHDMLYRSQDLARVDFAEYARTLALQLFRSYNAAGRIAYRVEIEEMVLGVDVAVPCGLIVNELVANALKHAFPQERRGEIVVRMKTDSGRCRLSVRDDGVGFPAQVDFLRTETLGLQLVRMLAEQIGGRVLLDTRAGTEFTVEFPQPQEQR